MSPLPQNPPPLVSLYTPNGARKYLTPEERQAFLEAAEAAPPDTRTFCAVLALTGCRISEARQLSADRVDMKAGVIVFESLKKRRSGVYRAVPVPSSLLDTLNLVHGIRTAQKRRGGGHGVLLWPFSRMTGFRRVAEVMEAAGVTGAHATAKGLRHGFGIAAVQAGIPLNMVQKWLGHASMQTTAIYADATEKEEIELAGRLWG